MAKSVNIPRHVRDPFYRYQMPSLQVRVQGRGNGIKTVIENMEDVARALNRATDYCFKFFSFNLGARTMLSHQNYIVNGRHEAESLAQSLDVFIEQFVLCATCQNPETQLQIQGGVKRSGSIVRVCQACGKTSACDMRERLSTYILKHPPQQSKRDQHYAQKRKVVVALDDFEKERHDDSDQKHTTTTINPTTTFTLDTSDAAMRQRRVALLGNLSGKLKHVLDDTLLSSLHSTEDAFVAIGNVLQRQNVTLDEKQHMVEAINAYMGWNVFQSLKAVFGNMFDTSIAKQLPPALPLLRRFIDVSQTEQQFQLLFCFELLATLYPKSGLPIANMLHYLYEQDILDEAIVLRWHTHPSKRIQEDVREKIRVDAQPFITWLQEADSASDNDDDSSESSSDNDDDNVAKNTLLRLHQLQNVV